MKEALCSLFALLALAPSLAAASLVSRGAPADAPLERPDGPRPPPAWSAEERSLFELINQTRAQHRLPRLRWDERVARIARRHSAEMMSNGRLDHHSRRQGPPPAGLGAGATPMERARAAAIYPALLLENIAEASTPEGIHEALLASPGHRRNILHPEVTELGVGVAVAQLEDGQLRLWVTEDFTRPPAPYTRETPEAALRRLVQLRERAGGAPLLRNASLGELAQETADLLSRGRLSPAEASVLVRNFLPDLGAYPELYVVSIRTPDVGQIDAIPALRDPGVTSYGLGVAPVRGRGAGQPEASAHVVLILGSRGAPLGLTSFADGEGVGFERFGP